MEAASSKITNAIRRFVQKKQIKEVYEKCQNCYSLYPLDCDIGDSVDIFVYNDLGSVKKAKSIMVSYCNVRKCFVFDVPKKKFKLNKLYRFNFVINGKIQVNEEFKTRKIDGRTINEVNFAEFDHKMEFNMKNIYNIKTFTIPRNKGNIKRIQSSKNVSNLQLIELKEDDFNHSNQSDDSTSTGELSPTNHSSLKGKICPITFKSILKQRRTRKMNPERKVSFGDVLVI
jgi:hypothetical protein